MPRIAVLLLLTPLLMGGRGELLGLGGNGWLGSGQACTDGEPPDHRNPWEGKEPVLISAESETPIRLGRPTCLGGECGVQQMRWPTEGADGLQGLVLPKADLEGGRLHRMGGTVGFDPEWAVNSPPPGPPCWGSEELRPVVRSQSFYGDAPGVGAHGESCSWTPTADGSLAVQSRALSWTQASGWESYSHQQWRVLRSVDGAWSPATPWLLAADENVRGLHRPIMIWELGHSAFDAVFADRGGIGGGTSVWLDEVRRGDSGAWSNKGGRPTLTSPHQPCD